MLKNLLKHFSKKKEDEKKTQTFQPLYRKHDRIINQQLAKDIPETIQRYNNEVIPAVILIPSNRGSLNIGLENINKNVEKAVGSNIL